MDKLPPKLEPTKTKNKGLLHRYIQWTSIVVLLIIVPIVTFSFICIGFYSDYNSAYCSNCNVYYGAPYGENFNFHDYNGEKCFECNKTLSNFLFKSESDKYSELNVCPKCRIIERNEERLITKMSEGPEGGYSTKHKVCGATIIEHSQSVIIKVIAFIIFGLLSLFPLYLLICLSVRVGKYILKNA